MANPDYTKFKIILDVPTLHPGLGFDDYARALREVIMTNDPRFAVGVFGTWGSGKTTLLNLVKAGLTGDDVIIVDFSAWKYEKEQHLIVPLLDCIRDALVKWSEKQPKSVADIAKKTARTIGQATLALLNGFSLEVGVPEVVKASFDANKALETGKRMGAEEKAALVPRSFYQASFNALDEAFAEITGNGKMRRFVVVIDDLDRCLPEGALEVLESMKLFFDTHGFVFLVGLDQRVVERCIDAKYAKEFNTTEKEIQIRGADYIKKIFQVPFTLARITVNQLDDFVDLLCAHSGLDVEQQNDLQQRVKKHLTYLATESAVNPRELKRYINAYTIVMKINSTLEPDVVLALQTLSFRSDWSVAFEALLADREMFLDALCQPDPATALANLDDDLAALPQSFFAYFSPNSGPGAPLAVLPPYELDRHLFSGQLSRSGAGADAMETVRAAGHLKRVVREIGTTSTAADAIQVFGPLHKQIQEMSTGSAAHRSIFTTAEGLKARLGAPPPPQATVEFKEWKQDANVYATKLVEQLRDLYQSGA
jgi:hypothetical protein